MNSKSLTNTVEGRMVNIRRSTTTQINGCLPYHWNAIARMHKTNTISRQSLVTIRYFHFNLPLFSSTSAAGQRRTEFQVAKLWNKQPINLRAVPDPIEFRRELRLHLLGSAAGALSR